MVGTIYPELRWAQRSSASDPTKNKLWITIAVADLVESKVSTTETTFKFTGKDSMREYAVELELFDEIDSDLTREVATKQKVVVELRKKNLGVEYWPRLTKEKKRLPFIHTDFDKWVDEDEQDEVPEEDPMAALQGMGGMPGMGDMSGMGGMPGMGGDGADQASMEELQKLLKSMSDGQGGMPGQAADEDEENDETTSELGKAKD